MSEKVLFGFYEEDFTPEKSVNLPGQFYERVSVGVESRVYAAAMAVKSGDEQMVIVSCDLMGVYWGLTQSVREKVDGYKGLDASKIMLHATHTHASVGFSAPGPIKPKVSSGLNVLKSIAPDLHYLEMKADKAAELGWTEAKDYLAEHIATAVKRAWDDLHPAYYQFGFGRAAIGMNRRVVFDDGSAQMWGDTSVASFECLEDGNDSGIELCYIFNAEKKLEGVVINLACPSQIMGQRSYISADYWDKVRIILRRRFGEDLKIIGLCAPAGDLCPRDLTRWVDPETPIKDPNIRRPNHLKRRADPSTYDVAGTWKIGKRICNEVIDTFEELPEGELKDTAQFEHRVRVLDLPYRKVTLAEYNNAKAAVEDFVKSAGNADIGFEDTARMHVYGGILARYENQQEIDVFPSECHFVRFDDVAIATSPFELFHNFGNQIRARSRAMQTMQIQLTNDYAGYLPTERAEKGGHYSAYVSSGSVGHEGGDLLVRESLKNINEMFKDFQ